jgi:hypothetical protein
MSVKEQLDLKQKEIDRVFQERKFQAEQQNVQTDNERAAAAETRQAERDAQQARVEAERLGLDRKRLGLEGQRVGLESQRVALSRQEANKPQGTEVVKLPAAVAEKVAGVEQSLSVLKDLERLKKDAWLGPIDGWATKKRISIPGLSVPDDLGKFSAQTSTLKNAVIKATTGAAMSEPEAQRIMEQIPDFTDKPEMWVQKAQATKENLALLRRRMLELSGVPQEAEPAGGGKTVKMRSPNGQEKDVPADKVDFYKSKGAMVVSN